jgi:hypothetical protein
MRSSMHTRHDASKQLTSCSPPAVHLRAQRIIDQIRDSSMDTSHIGVIMTESAREHGAPHRAKHATHPNPRVHHGVTRNGPFAEGGALVG